MTRLDQQISAMGAQTVEAKKAQSPIDSALASLDGWLNDLDSAVARIIDATYPVRQSSEETWPETVVARDPGAAPLVERLSQSTEMLSRICARLELAIKQIQL
jgi:hypothetical protein